MNKFLLFVFVLLSHFTYIFASEISREMPQGSGTPSDPFLIETAENLYWYADLLNLKLSNEITDAHIVANHHCARLTQDITINYNLLDADGKVSLSKESLVQWTPIASVHMQNCMLSVFDGDGHTISGLYCEHSVAGFIGYARGSSEIKNLTIKDSYFKAVKLNDADDALYAGGLVAYTTSNISNCFVQATVAVDTVAVETIKVGGLCGYYMGYKGRSILNSAHVGIVSAPTAKSKMTSKIGHAVGGLIGHATSYDASGSIAISGCFHSGEISTTTTCSAGTMIGYATSTSKLKNFAEYTISNCIVCSTNADLKSVGGIDGTTSSTKFSFVAVEPQLLSSGEACYLLNDKNTDSPAWRQTLGSDGIPTLSSNADVVYFAEGTHEDCVGVEHTGYSNVNFDKTIHMTEFTPGIPSTCAAIGTLDVYICAKCGKLFADELCESELEVSDLMIPKMPHDYTLAWTWNEANTAAMLTAECHADESHNQVIEAIITCDTVVSATCRSDGKVEVTATANLDGDEKANRVSLSIPKLEHQDCNGDQICDLCGEKPWAAVSTIAEDANIKVTYLGQYIVEVDGCGDAQITVHAADGRAVYVGTDSRIHLPQAGMYIVSVLGRTSKVLVK